MMKALLFLTFFVIYAHGQAQCPIFQFTSDVVEENSGWVVRFNPQTSRTLDFVIVHYRSNPAGDWINQRMTSVSNSEWMWPLDIDLFSGESLTYWFTYCSERVDCDSPEFVFSVPVPIETPPPETTTAPPAYSQQEVSSAIPLAPAYVSANRGGYKSKGGKYGGHGHGGGGYEQSYEVPYVVSPATVYQSAPVSSPSYYAQSSYGAGPASSSSYGAGPASSSSYGAGPASFDQTSNIIPSAVYSDGGGHSRGYGKKRGYPVVGANPSFGAASYSQSQFQSQGQGGPY
jgi:hypothetical protein